jgi:glycerol-3-phosphate O-acyltransferase
MNTDSTKNNSKKKPADKLADIVIKPHEEVIREPVMPNWRDWPIVRLSDDRESFLQILNKSTWDKVLQLTANSENLHDEIQKAIYLEKIRVRQKPWRVDPKDELQFWDGIKKELVNVPFETEDERLTEERLLSKIIQRYSSEIVGMFNIRTFHFAERFIPFGFATLLNALTYKNFKTLYKHKVHIQDRVQITGAIDHVRELSKLGTVIIVPTHYSNLDSIMVGWAIDAIGLPPFLYGAGLNLFNNPILAWFMSRLGAYKVDRRKKNLIYLETLKTYSKLALQRGCHTLFFPGGTRSRSGAIESNLKMGLLSTAFDAQRINYATQGENAKKIFIVPLTINYHFVLEAPSLINEFLKSAGQEKYLIDSNNFTNFWMIFKFIWKFFSTKSELVLRFGQPIDVMGNSVDAQGVSKTANGQEISVRSYFESGGELVEDTQRDWEYTKLLSKKIVASYLQENVVLSSHIVAFVAFNMMRKKFKKLDLYALLRLPAEDRGIPLLSFQDQVSELLNKLKTMYANGQLQLAAHLDAPVHEVVKHGLHHLGIYHAKRALLLDKFGEITSEDMRLLYYYHNRLLGYGLEDGIEL